MVKPSWEIVPLPPLPASSSMSSEIGLPSATIEPLMCTEEAVEAAVLVASRICSGDFDSIPLPDEEDEEPQPASARASTSAQSANRATFLEACLIGERLAAFPVASRRSFPSVYLARSVRGL